MTAITQAFVLGAGLGTRLRPLTEHLPKALVPIFQKRLITFALDHLVDAGCSRFCVNTHHESQRFDEVFPDGKYRGYPLRFRHEPVLLETGGGIANVRDLLGREPFLVYNSDILSDLPLERLLREHERAGNLVTLALRSHSGPQEIAFDHVAGKVIDIRNRLGTGQPDEFVFTGIYAVQPEFLDRLEMGVKRSVIPTFLELIEDGAKLGGVIVDEGHWWDVGTRAAYMQLHRDLSAQRFPQYAPDVGSWRDRIHETAQVEAGAELRGCSVVGANAQVGAGAIVEDTIVWPAAQIASRSNLRNCIVRSHQKAQGTLCGVDI